MRWHAEQWVKLYRTKPPEWLLLSVSARGLGRELLTYVDELGRIPIGKDKPWAAVAYLLGARPREHRRIAEDVGELLKDGYLVVDGEHLLIRNYVEAQDRTPGAKRTAEWRKRKNEEHEQRHRPRTRDEVAGAIVASLVTQPVTSRETPHVPSRTTSHEQHANARSDLMEEEDLKRKILSETKTPLLPPEEREVVDVGPITPECGAILSALRRSPRTLPMASRAWGDELAILAAGARPEDLEESIRTCLATVGPELSARDLRKAIVGYVRNTKRIEGQQGRLADPQTDDEDPAYLAHRRSVAKRLASQEGR